VSSPSGAAALPSSAPRVDLEWGLQGARHLAADADAIVVVDVLSFCTSVTVACERGACVWPHPGGEEAQALARSLEAVLAGTRSHREGPSLSPTSLLDLPDGTRLVLPSPNGSSLTHALMTSRRLVVAGCLRNAAAAARRVAASQRVLLLCAGEQWGDGSLRFAYEDLVGAGAVVERLTALVPELVRSPEAHAASLAFRDLLPLELTRSGTELVDRGFAADVELASQVDVSEVAPVLVEGRFASTVAEPQLNGQDNARASVTGRQ
jgi:2-phosphosulfolactate phosphatase